MSRPKLSELATEIKVAFASGPGIEEAGSARAAIFDRKLRPAVDHILSTEGAKNDRIQHNSLHIGRYER